MKPSPLFAVLLFILAGNQACLGVETRKCVNGAEGIKTAASFAAAHWPDVKFDAENLLVSCKPQDEIANSISSCGQAKVSRVESCAMFKATLGRPARIDISHDEDAAISTCHELQHLRDAVWNTPGGCQEHDISCFYDTKQVQRCEQAVFEFRGVK